MVDDTQSRPECFGQLGRVFPVDEQGIRTSPQECMRCPLCKSCLQTAMAGPEGLKLKEERVDLAYEHGIIGTLERWSRKKLIRREIQTLKSKASSKRKEK